MAPLVDDVLMPNSRHTLFASVLCLAMGPLWASDGATTPESDDEDDTSRWAGGVLEYGVGVTRLSFPHYPGSDQSHVVILPFPYLTYHSENMDLDGSELQGRLWQGDRFTLDISSGGALRVDADDNVAREGMDDLGWLGEVGPALRYSPEWTPARPENWQYRLSLPLRQALEVKGSSLSRRGLILAPNIEVQRDFYQANTRWEFQGRLGARFGSESYHQHFYGVPLDQATDDRPAYTAEAGLTAYELSLGLSWRRGSWWLGGFVRHQDFSDSQVIDSPLLRETRQQFFGLSGAYILGKRHF